MSDAELIALAAVAISFITLATTLWRQASTSGVNKQRITNIETALKATASADNLKAVEDRLMKLASAELVIDTRERLEALEHTVSEVQQAIGRMPIIETKLDGLDRLMVRELDEMKHTLRKLEDRSFAPRAVPRKPPQH